MKACEDCKYFGTTVETRLPYCMLHGFPTKAKSEPCEKFKEKENKDEQKRGD